MNLGFRTEANELPKFPASGLQSEPLNTGIPLSNLIRANGFSAGSTPAQPFFREAEN